MTHNDLETNFVSAVVYCRDNEKNIKEFIRMLYRVFEKHFQKFEFIIANDASTDRSVEILKDISTTKPNNTMSIVNMSYIQGIEQSMNAGVDHAIGDFVFEFDRIDVDYNETIIYDLYLKALSGYDIVSARNTNQKFTSKIFYSMYNLFSKNQYPIGSDTFRLLSRRAINRIHSLSKMIPYRKGLYANSGLRNEVIIYHPSTKVKTTHSLKFDRQETAISTLVIFTDAAYKVALSFSFILMFSMISVAIYTLVFYLMERTVEGFTTIMLFLTGAFFGVFAIMTIVIKYLSVLVDLVFLKQKYLIESVEKVKGK
jgi:dolichol-phosphate mannosyltransferase